ncbi:MAG: low molecular weight phosphotyrosine protein phosphatase [Bacteroidetes bacterium]|nr:low molecular weight phosphotyrosine protein phosphatase [Bacteroidota bacterium]MCH8035122.1 low molecular weight phosphotyrosine protein phosphatase [Bacteroidota bacterium]
MNKKRILFVCMGNICRSPAAEAIMKKTIEKNNLSDKIEIDSAGTIEYHSGESADSRMIVYAKKRGYIVDSTARQFDMAKDFEQFDYIVTMDNENLEDIKSMDVLNNHKHKIFRMVDFCENCTIDEIPDPYYNSASGFEEVLDMLEDATNGLLNRVINDIKQQDKSKN